MGASAALVLALAAGGRAAPPAQTGELDDLWVEVESPWPASVSRGFFPVWFHLENRAERARDAKLVVRAGSQDQERKATKDVQLEPGQRDTVEMYVPAFHMNAAWKNSYTAEMRMGGGRTAHLGGVVDSVTEPSLRTAVVFSEKGWDQAEIETWKSDLKTADLPSRRGPKAPNVEIVTADFGRMPASYVAYTSLDAVVLDVAPNLPRAESLAPLAAWVRLGGRLVLLGPDAVEKAQASPALAPWLEERFLLDEGELGSVFACGLGSLYVGLAADRLFDAPANLALVERALRPPSTAPDGRRPSPVPGVSTSALDWRASMAIPGVGELPLETFVLLLLVFAVAIGPVNFMVLRKLRRPSLLLVTIPAVSLGTSVALVLYGMLQAGVDVKTASVSLTLLDQREDRAHVVEERVLYAGLSPGAGLRPAAGTSVYPRFADEDPDFYEVDYSRGVLMARGYLPVRTPAHQLLLSERTSRLGLSFAAGDGGLRVTNELDVAVAEVLARDADGTLHHVEPASPIAAGSSVRLEALEAMDGDSVPDLAAELDNALLDALTLPPASYVARLAAPAFTDDCGIDLNERTGSHVVFGVLPANPEDW